MRVTHPPASVFILKVCNVDVDEFKRIHNILHVNIGNPISPNPNIARSRGSSRGSIHVQIVHASSVFRRFARGIPGFRAAANMQVVLVIQKRTVSKKHVKTVFQRLTGVNNSNIRVSWNQQREDTLLQSYGTLYGNATESSGCIGITKLRQELCNWGDPFTLIETDGRNHTTGALFDDPCRGGYVSVLQDATTNVSGSTWVRDEMVSGDILPPLTIEQETSRWNNVTRGFSQNDYTAWQNTVSPECHDLMNGLGVRMNSYVNSINRGEADLWFFAAHAACDLRRDMGPNGVVLDFTTTTRSSKNEAQWGGINTISGDEIGKGDISIGMSLDT